MAAKTATKLSGVHEPPRCRHHEGDNVIAALFVERDGVYYGLSGVDPWGEDRDARNYAGPHRVVAHPPCARWGRYWPGGPSTKVRRKLGDDGGCFAAALRVVIVWGGVLEHPEASHAWRVFNIATPPRGGGWVKAGLFVDGWTCCVEQGHYGNISRKPTWLLACGDKPKELIWGPCVPWAPLEDRYHTAEERRKAVRRGIIELLSKKRRAATPVAFRDLLIDIASGGNP